MLSLRHKCVLSGLVLGLAIGLGGTTQTQAQTPPQSRTLNMQATWPASLTLYENFTFWADRMEKLSAGTLKINAMPAGQVVPAFEVLDATHKKVLDGAHAWGGYWTGKDKTSILFTGGPGGTFGMDFTDFMGWMYEGGGFELYQEFFQKQLKLNVVAISVLPSGPQAFGWFKQPITSVEDMKGMKCRQSGISGEIWKSLGFTIVNVPAGEIIPSAQRGVIDCAEWVGGLDDLRLGFHNVWKFHYTPGLHENTTVGELLFNKDVWESMTDQQHEWIKSAASDAYTIWQARWHRQNATALKEMQEKHGVQVMQTPRDVLMAYINAWDKLAAEESERNPFFKKVLESQRAHAALVVPYKRFYFPPYSFMANHYFPQKK